MKYNHKDVESKWQKKWGSEKIYEPIITDAANSKFYNLWMFPYPSAEGLHAGHAFASTGSDIYGRFKRMQGAEVFQPIGYDSFGIHSENYAIKIGETPQTMLSRTTKHYEKQLRSLGHGYDWTRTVTTSDPDYYSGTQWLFKELFKSGLAYKKMAYVNFCPSCKTVLADEQAMSPAQAGKEPKDADGVVIADKDSWEDLKICERCGTVVEKKELLQWFFRITDYAKRLLNGLGKIDWSERVKIAQNEWIGLKDGVVVSHKVKDMDLTLDAFSAYPAWLFADTFLVLAPEHPLVNDLVINTKYHKDVTDFLEKHKKSKVGKKRKQEEKLGAFTGRYAIDPLTGREFPIWLANFALMEFGTGVIRCSAHDVRDYEFASKYGIATEEVVERTETDMPVNAHLNRGILKNSGDFTGKEISDDLIGEILDWIEEKGYGKRKSSYHLRDWLVSRQRYWGAPIPLIYCERCASGGQSYITEAKEKIIHQDQSDWDHAGWWVEESLPVVLPPMKEYKPSGDGHGPLSHHPEFFKVICPHCGSDAVRETDVMDTFVDSSWYFLKYPSKDIKDKDLPWDKAITDNWLPVDLYFGGAEHSVLHLMYARFVTMVFKDLGYIDFEEPFPRFFAHGLMIKDGAKMSKSRGNVVNPDEYVAKYGADTLRLYLMFMGPMDGYPDFRDTGIEGMQKFVTRFWKIYNDYQSIHLVEESDIKLLRNKLHNTIKKVTENVNEFKYNTAIASLMEYVNFLYEIIGKSESRQASGSPEWDESLRSLCLLMAPFAPHLAEEIWVNQLGEEFSIHRSAWPEFNKAYIQLSEVLVIIQVNGKVRGQLTLAVEDASDRGKVENAATNDANIQKWLIPGVKKVVFVPAKLINFVVKE